MADAKRPGGVAGAGGAGSRDVAGSLAREAGESELAGAASEERDARGPVGAGGAGGADRARVDGGADARLPGLSTGGWAAVLGAGLFALTVGFFPFVARRAASRMLEGKGLSVLAGLALSDWFGPLVAAFAVAAIFAGVTGTKGSRVRNGWAYSALAVAVAGTALVYGVLYANIIPR